MDAVLAVNETERLRAELAGRTIFTPEQRAAVKSEAAREVELSPAWGAWRELATRVVKLGRETITARAEAQRTLRPDVYEGEFVPASRERYAGQLRAMNKQVGKLREQVLTRFPKPSRAWPTNSADAINLHSKIVLLDLATPAEAARLVREAIETNDTAFMHASEVALKSWPATRNAWKEREASRLAHELVIELEGAHAVEPDVEAGSIAAERAAEFDRAWRLLVSLALNGEGNVDNTYFATGSFSPLLEGQVE